jgi:hypothetical protein
MSIRQITRSEAVKLTARIQSALEAEFGKDGLTVKVEGCQFNNLTFKPKLTVSVKDSNGTNAAEKANWDMYCWGFGLSPDDYGKQFIDGRGDAFTISALHPNRQRFPISATRVHDGASFKFSEDVVIRCLQGKARSVKRATKSSKFGEVDIPEPMCEYCKKRPQEPHNHGACASGACIIKAMGAHL